MVQSDRLPAHVADALRQHGGPLTGPEGLKVIGEVAAQVAANKGRLDLLDPVAGQRPTTVPPALQGLGGNGQATGRGPIRDPARWNAAREDVKQHVARLADLAAGAGDRDLAAIVLAIGATPDAASKSKLATNYLNQLPPDRAALAQRVLADPVLLRGTTPTETP